MSRISTNQGLGGVGKQSQIGKDMDISELSLPKVKQEINSIKVNSEHADSLKRMSKEEIQSILEGMPGKDKGKNLLDPSNYKEMTPEQKKSFEKELDKHRPEYEKRYRDNHLTPAKVE